MEENVQIIVAGFMSSMPIVPCPNTTHLIPLERRKTQLFMVDDNAPSGDLPRDTAAAKT
jgi:hypothetical protein